MEEEQIYLPPGFRFHPTDEELVGHYLAEKINNGNYAAIAIGEVDLNRCEPWDLPARAKMGEKEWYFYCVRDRKYPTGMRTNRATDAGYWKATGKDKEVFKGRALVGMKKTLVFYRGRAPKGEKTNWVMHEYRSESQSQDGREWVICRVFKKSSAGKNIPLSGLGSPTSHDDDQTVNINDAINSERARADMLGSFRNQQFNASNPAYPPPTMNNNLRFSFTRGPAPVSGTFYQNQYGGNPMSYGHEYPSSAFMSEDSIMRMMFEEPAQSLEQKSMAELSQETGLSTDQETAQRSFEEYDGQSASAGTLDIDSYLASEFDYGRV